MTFKVFTVMAMTISVFLDMTPCSLVDMNQYLGGTCWSILGKINNLKTEGKYTSETSVPTSAAGRKNPK